MTGTSVLAMLTFQASMLALLLSGSAYLQTLSTKSVAPWGADGVIMLLLGMTYLALAIGLWTRRRWTGVLAMITLVSLVAAAIVAMSDDRDPGLGFVLVVFMCASINLAVIGWLGWRNQRVGPG